MWRPILAGLWKQHEAWDGTYTFQDLVEVNQALDYTDENKRRAREAADRAGQGR